MSDDTKILPGKIEQLSGPDPSADITRKVHFTVGHAGSNRRLAERVVRAAFQAYFEVDEAGCEQIPSHVIDAAERELDKR